MTRNWYIVWLFNKLSAKWLPLFSVSSFSGDLSGGIGEISILLVRYWSFRTIVMSHSMDGHPLVVLQSPIESQRPNLSTGPIKINHALVNLINFTWNSHELIFIEKQIWKILLILFFYSFLFFFINIKLCFLCQFRNIKSIFYKHFVLPLRAFMNFNLFFKAWLE